MEIEEVTHVPLEVLANKAGNASPVKPPVKVEHSPSPPSLIEDTAGILEDGETDEQQDEVSSLRRELQLSGLEYSVLNERFKRLERQHNELQGLASAYSEVIRGFAPANGQTVSIDQLQAEAGREGLRAKALEADVLRPLVREAGGSEALISETHTLRSLIDKAGGLQALEKFVSDLRTVRDTLDELRGSQGLGGLASEVRDLLISKQQHAALKSRMDGPNGLEVKAARYEKLMQAFSDVQNNTFAHKHSPNAPTFDKTFTDVRPVSKVAMRTGGQQARSVQPVAEPATMNPARARLISATPFEADPNRDLYEARPVAKPLNKTGSNKLPLGIPQAQPTAKPINHGAGSVTLKRKGADNITPSVPAKRPRVDLGRASALVQASLTAATSNPVGRASSQSTRTSTSAVTAGFKTRAQPSRAESEDNVTGDASSGL